MSEYRIKDAGRRGEVMVDEKLREMLDQANENAERWQRLDEATQEELASVRKELEEAKQSEQWFKTYFLRLNLCGRHESEQDDHDAGECIFCELEQSTKQLERAEAALRRAFKALGKYIDWQGAVHVGDCPEDDTCRCPGRPVNDLVNAVMNELEAFESEKPAPQEKPE
jgi:DNA repair exonuclease SbcCD ATPase subunit